MKIKTTYKNQKDQPTPTFPCTKIWAEDARRGVAVPLVVLFKSSTVGTVISSDNNARLGECQSYWIPCNHSDWLDFEGTIEFTK